MKKLVLAAALLAGGGLAIHDVAVGHGGTYRGPGDTVPPGGGGGGGGGGPASGPSGPSSPGSSGPSGPGPSSPGRSAGGPASGPKRPKTQSGGASDDLTGWEFWWGFNKEPYLNLKAAIHSGGALTGSDDFFLGKGEKTQAKDSMRPSEEAIRQQIVPALLSALEGETNNDIVTGCLIALAKIGDPADEAGAGKAGFADVIQKSLTSSSQEIKETAALALGILGNESALPVLTGLALDTPEGLRAISKGNAATSVDERTRSFAIYGLGLIGYRTADNDVRKQIVDSLITVLEGDGLASAQRDMSVAALTSMGLTPIDSQPDWTPPEEGGFRGNECREAQIAWLLDYYAKDDVNFLVRAHCPIAMARLVQFADPRAQFENEADQNMRDLKAKVASRLVEDIGKHSKAQNEIVQSAVLALGLLGDADEDPIDQEIRKALIEAPENHVDLQVRNFAMIAMAHVGGRPGFGEGDSLAGTAEIRKKLLNTLSKGNTRLKRWAAVGLGVLERSLTDAGQLSSSDSGKALRLALSKAKSASDIGANAIALGIMKDPEAKSIIADQLEKASDPDARGYCAVSLGLIGDRSVIEQIQEVVRSSKYRPELLRSAAIGLGLLGDKDLVPELTQMLRDAKALSAQASISKALGFIGDARSIEPLIEMLQNESLTGGARGFAAVALGIVADKEELPWNAKVSVNMNYRANTATLTDSKEGTGLLDIL